MVGFWIRYERYRLCPYQLDRLPSSLVLRGKEASKPSLQNFEYFSGPGYPRVNSETSHECGDIRFSCLAFLLNVTDDGLNQWSLTDCRSDPFTEQWLIHARWNANSLRSSRIARSAARLTSTLPLYAEKSSSGFRDQGYPVRLQLTRRLGL